MNFLGYFARAIANVKIVLYNIENSGEMQCTSGSQNYIRKWEIKLVLSLIRPLPSKAILLKTQIEIMKYW